jgi:hypothetical protein
VLLAVIVAIALAGLGILLVLAIGLFRHMKLLAGSLARLQKELQPLLEEIQAGSMQAQQHAGSLSDRGRGRQVGASSEDLGAKLRS